MWNGFRNFHIHVYCKVCDQWTFTCNITIQSLLFWKMAFECVVANKIAQLRVPGNNAWTTCFMNQLAPAATEISLQLDSSSFADILFTALNPVAQNASTQLLHVWNIIACKLHLEWCYKAFLKYVSLSSFFFLLLTFIVVLQHNILVLFEVWCVHFHLAQHQRLKPATSNWKHFSRSCLVHCWTKNYSPLSTDWTPKWQIWTSFKYS